MSIAVAERPPVQPWKPKSRVQKPAEGEGSSPGGGGGGGGGGSGNQSAQRSPANESTTTRMESPTAGTVALGGKHPLQNRWSMWYFKNDKAKDWKSNQRLIASCDTVEDFWALFNHLKPPSGLQAGCDYSFFKEGIEPMWEDPRNIEGGRWLINLQRHQRNVDLDMFWQETLLCLIGEIFDPYSDEVLGAVVNIRPKGDKLAIWTADAEKKNQIMNIGKNMKAKLNVPRNMQIEFQAHKDTSSKSGSTTKKKHVI